MTDKRAQIMDVAERMIRTSGYNGFSFREIASEVDVKSASVHYYFATKSDLATAVAKRFRERFEAEFNARTAPGDDPVVVLRDLFREALNDGGLMCLCGILAVEGDELPPDVAHEARSFMQYGINTIAGLEGYGRQEGMRIFAQLEGAMLLARSMGDISAFDEATQNLGLM